jgi:hypothetical protein
MFSFFIGFGFAVFLIVCIVFAVGSGFLFLAKTAPKQLGEMSERVIKELEK